MNHTIKLFFDVCLSSRLPKVIKTVYEEDYPGLQVNHLTEFFKAADDDKDWLPLLEEDKDWIVVTADRGKDPKKEKLPLLCSQLKISHISLTPSFHQEGYSAHKHGLLSVFPQIACIAFLPKGTRFTLCFRPYHQRNLPYLLIEGHPFDAWCKRNAISVPGLINPN